MTAAALGAASSAEPTPSTGGAASRAAEPAPAGDPPVDPASSRRHPDTIRLTGLRVGGRHGVYPAERQHGQDFVIDVELELDLAPAAASDDVSATVHYGQLAQGLATIVSGPPVNLIETLADRLAQACLADPRVTAATVTVHKPQAPIPLNFADVAVTVRRTAASGGPA